mgnify:CR=1 FL=1
MLETLLVDIFEPDTLLELIKTSIPTRKESLNVKGFADYYWLANSQGEQVERKQVGEVLGSMDNVEGQIRKELMLCPNLTLLVEGVIEPTEVGCDTYVKSLDKPYYRLSHSFGSKKYPQYGLYSKYVAWKWQLWKAGVIVIETSCLDATALAIVSLYKNSHNPEHTTLRRYLRDKLPTWQPNPQIEALWGLAQPFKVGLGIERCSELIASHESIWAVLHSKGVIIEDKATITALAKLLRIIGKEE